MGGDPVPALVAIANLKDESFAHRAHAISLLATFHNSRAEAGLTQITNDSDPTLRCLGLQSLVESQSRNSIPTLINKLEDHETCLTKNSTDPPGKYPVYVSDEAVRLLELVTGLSFDREELGSHRKTQPWKEWWLKQKTTSSSPPPKGRGLSL
jgi:hypothetical protein